MVIPLIRLLRPTLKTFEWKLHMLKDLKRFKTNFNEIQVYCNKLICLIINMIYFLGPRQGPYTYKKVVSTFLCHFLLCTKLILIRKTYYF